MKGGGMILMFDYNVRFERIREQDRSGWRH